MMSATSERSRTQRLQECGQPKAETPLIYGVIMSQQGAKANPCSVEAEMIASDRLDVSPFWDCSLKVRAKSERGGKTWSR